MMDELSLRVRKGAKKIKMDLLLVTPIPVTNGYTLVKYLNDLQRHSYMDLENDLMGVVAPKGLFINVDVGDFFTLPVNSVDFNQEEPYEFYPAYRVHVDVNSAYDNALLFFDNWIVNWTDLEGFVMGLYFRRRGKGVVFVFERQ